MYRKQVINKNWTDCEYHVQKKEDVNHTNVEISCETAQLTEFPFCVTHSKSHGVWSLSKQYHLQLYLKMVHGTCEI